MRVTTQGPGDTPAPDPHAGPAPDRCHCGGELEWPCIEALPEDGAPRVCLQCSEVLGYVCGCRGCRKWVAPRKRWVAGVMRELADKTTDRATARSLRTLAKEVE